MDVTLAWTVLVVAVGVLLMASFTLRNRLARPVVDGLLAVAGAGIGVGGLLFLHDVGVASWIVTPFLLAAFAVLHVRALFAGAGPFRT